ncbi:Undecaprenyl diphosphate synthase, partial [Aureobasidium melanogenum]
LRQLIKAALHLLLYNLIHFAFSVYHRFRVAYHNLIDRVFAVLYYHHRTPEYIQKDVHRLKKLPKHLSIILELDDDTHDNSSLEALIHNVCEVAAWSACAGVPLLSIYEPTGLLKQSLPLVHRRISRTLAAYFGHDNPNKPTLSLGAPHMQSFSPPASPKSNLDANSSKSPPHLSILLLSASDGRGTLVDLTKTLAEMSQKGKLAPKDISMDLVDAELTESVMG